MPNPYLDNAERWLALAETDYLTQFVKAWIPFNAWYMNMYPTLSRDREIINEIKSNSNLFRDRLIALINGKDTESIDFKMNLFKLHKSLEAYYIPNANNRISFNSITVERNPQNVETLPFRRWSYKVEIIYRGANYTINSLVTDSNGTTQYTKNQSKYDAVDLQNDVNTSSSLTGSQLTKLLETYEKINPNKPICLVSNNPKNSIVAGEIYFKNDVNKLTKGIIEILYRLRNILFHGELIPSNDNKKVYEPAYFILKTLIQSLK